jgi:hypothetical protein
MGLEERLDEIKGEALKKIEHAAKKGDIQALFENMRIVEKAEQLIRRLQEIGAATDVLEKEASGRDGVRVIRIKRSAKRYVPEKVEEGVSPRMRGEILRNGFVQNLQSFGINLIRKKGSVYETQTKGLVGIAYASERNRDHWFLSLPPNDYDCMIFLCENEKGEVLSFILPGEFYHNHRHQFSDSKGQLKFNIHHRGGRYELNIPGGTKETLNQFEDNYEPLK